MSVRLYKCFKADHRVSMDVYARRVADGLMGLGESVEEFRPQSRLESFSQSRITMRWLRYVEYPRQLRQRRHQDSDLHLVHHVVDHGYAHLGKQLSGARAFISVHDLIPILAWRGRFGSAHKGRKPLLALHSAQYLKKFTRLIASSRHTADDLMREMGIPSQKIEVVSLPLASGFARGPADQIKQFRERCDLQPGYFWILVSGSEFYKNHATVLRVFNRLRKMGLPVKLLRAAKTGLNGSPLAEVNAEDIKSIYVPQQELPLLFSAVDCLLFPSLYEGFGYPVAEALACGTPVVCSNAASLPEVGGDVALYADPLDDEALANHIREVMRDSAFTEQVRLAGPQQVSAFQGEAVGRRLQHVYHTRP